MPVVMMFSMEGITKGSLLCTSWVSFPSSPFPCGKLLGD